MEEEYKQLNDRINQIINLEDRHTISMLFEKRLSELKYPNSKMEEMEYTIIQDLHNLNEFLLSLENSDHTFSPN